MTYAARSLFGLFLLASVDVGFAAIPPAGDAPDALVETWDFAPDPALPNILILGDSISIGYTLGVRAQLAGRANVFRPLEASRTKPENCRDTPYGLAHLDAWIAGRRWDVIHFNWGLWDLCYRNPSVDNSGNRDKAGGAIAVGVEEYARNLDRLVTRLAATGARLIWANTTIVPPDEPGRIVGDDVRYNAAAASVMARHAVVLNDLHAITATWPAEHFRARGDVHPTPAGAAILAAAVVRAVREALPPPPLAPTVKSTAPLRSP